MDPAKRRELASKGGKSVAPEHRYYARNPLAAVESGSKGGSTPRRKAKSAG